MGKGRVSVIQAAPPQSGRSGIDLAIDKGVACLLDSFKPLYRHLPEPVRFRACGALEAWNAAIELAGPYGKMLDTLLSNPICAPMEMLSAMAEFIDTFSTRDWRGADSALIKRVAVNSASLLSFWRRNGALLEPTHALHRLLDVSDIGTEIPLALLQLPSPTVCIIAPPELRDAPHGFHCMTLFEHGVAHEWGMSRCLTFVVYSQDRMDTVVLDVVSDTESIAQGLQAAGQRTTMPTHMSIDVKAAAAHMQQHIAYATKLLLYMSMDSACVAHEQPYSMAPRVFPGLGQRKRMQRLAEIEQLYDRYIVGPAILDGDLHQAGEHGGDHHEVSAHWRRGHFRLQPHGPAMSLRKVMFIKPIIVRADRLADAL